MAHLFRSFLTVGVVTITAAAIAIVPSVAEPKLTAARPQVVHVAAPTITLTAGVQPLAGASLTDILALIVQHYVVPPSAGAPFPSPPQLPPAVTPTSIGSSIIGIYNAVEPWARWVADVAAYAVGWIPYVGWLAPQIQIFYNFGERIARSITYNIAHWLDGNISFGQGLINVGVDTVNAFIQLGIDQWNFWLWPLPPLPPIFPGATASATAELTTTAAVTDGATVTETAVSDTPKLKKNGRGAEADMVGEQADALASTVVADQATEESQKKSEVEAAKEAKEPKTTTSSSEVTAQGEVRGAPIEKKTESANVNNGKTGKKGENGQTAEATSGASASATPSSDTGPKHGKKDETGKK